MDWSVPVKSSSPFGKASPGTWTSMVTRPWLVLDVVRSLSSVARTVNE